MGDGDNGAVGEESPDKVLDDPVRLGSIPVLVGWKALPWVKIPRQICPCSSICLECAHSLIRYSLLNFNVDSKCVSFLLHSPNICGSGAYFSLVLKLFSLDFSINIWILLIHKFIFWNDLERS